jgi:hypothetical protein
LTSDGEYLYTLCETSGTVEKETIKKYVLYVYDIMDTDKGIVPNQIHRIELSSLPAISEGAFSIPRGHDNVTCTSCHRMNFRVKRFRCKTCPTYNLCATCETSTSSGNSAVIGSHKDEHAFEMIDVSISSPEKKSTSAKPPPVPTALYPDGWGKYSFYCTGAQLGVLLPPRVNPNKTDKYVCRIFDLKENPGSFLYDLSTENFSMGRKILGKF